MNALELVIELQDGAILRCRYRRISYPSTRLKLDNWLKLPDGTMRRVQKSTIDGAARRGLVVRRYWQNEECDVILAQPYNPYPNRIYRYHEVVENPI